MPATAAALPPTLREGDRLDAGEFLHRWEAMPELRRAELIDGVVFVQSPVSLPHSDLHGEMHGWIWLYKDRTPGCQAGIECTWLMGPRDVPQPDLFLRILPEYGGQSGSKGQYAEGAPELIVEISGCRASRDLGVKLELYRRAGVREYLTVQLSPRQIVWRRLARGRYQEIQPDADGLLKSVAFPGLWLDAGAVWSSKKSIRTALEKGLRSADHAGFVQRLVGNK